MDGQAYLQVIERRLERYFDKKALVQGGLQLDLVAELHASDEGYFLVHSIKTYSVQHDEYLFVKHFKDAVTKEELEPYLKLLRGRMQELKTTTEHMSSLFALLLICEQGMDEQLKQELSKYKYHQDYCLRLRDGLTWPFMWPIFLSRRLPATRLAAKLSSISSLANNSPK